MRGIWVSDNLKAVTGLFASDRICLEGTAREVTAGQGSLEFLVEIAKSGPMAVVTSTVVSIHFKGAW